MFFFFFFIALSKKGDFTRQAWLMLLIDLSCWENTGRVCVSVRGVHFGTTSYFTGTTWNRASMPQFHWNIFDVESIHLKKQNKDLVKELIHNPPQSQIARNKASLYSLKNALIMRSLLLKMKFRFSLTLKGKEIGGQMVLHVLSQHISFVPYPWGCF